MRGGIFAMSLVLLHAHAAAAQDKPVEGPQQICLNYSRFDLPAGQSVTGFRGSVESMGLEVQGPGAGYSVVESETFAARQPRHGLVATYGTTKVYRYRDGGLVSYGIFGPAPFADGKPRQLVVLSGPAFTGGKADAAIYSRFRVTDPRQIKCDHRFVYGWDVMLPDASN